MDKTEIYTKALELAIHSHEVLGGVMVETSEILERARTFRDFLLCEEREECEQPPGKVREATGGG